MHNNLAKSAEQQNQSYLGCKPVALDHEIATLDH